MFETEELKRWQGNCKFGQKCALAHIMPDGRRANRASMMTNSNNVVVGPRIDPQFYQPSDPLPIQPLLAQQSDGMPPHFNFQRPILLEPEPPLQDGYISRPSDQMLPKDTGFISQPDSKYGSPREDTRYLSLSPSARLSVLDAPLPASFDSQGISYMARHGPVAASLPSKMGVFESSPPASLPKKSPMPLDSISNIGSSGPASREHRSRGPDLGSSPFGSGDEGFGPRFMHSRRTPKPKLLSTSMPRVDIPIEDSDDDAFHFSGGEEDYIPTSIHDQVLTHDEQQRRYSRTEQDRRAVREALSGINTPNDPSSKVGSPTVGSPSRYGPLFARQQQHQQQQYNNNEISSNLATSPSAFGHVGSPLRNSSLHPNASPSFRASKAPGDISPSFPSLSSPPRQSSMSVLSQQLSRTRLSSRAEAAFSAAAAGDNASTPKPTAYYPVPPTSSISTSNIAATAHRNISNSSSSQGGSRSTDRIEEEPVDGVFSMEDDFEDHQRKRHSGGNSIISNQAQPPAWSAVVAAASPPGAGFGKGPSRPAATSRTRATQGTGNGSGPVGTRKGGGS